MESLNFVRCVLGICAAAAVLAGCGGSQPPVSAPGAMRQAMAPRILPAGSFKVLYRFHGPDGQQRKRA